MSSSRFSITSRWCDTSTVASNTGSVTLDLASFKTFSTFTGNVTLANQQQK